MGLGRGVSKTSNSNPHMTRLNHPELLNNVLQLLTDDGSDAFAESLRILVNEAMHAERSVALSARPFERTESRKGYANGFKPKTLKTRLGAITFAVPQVRGDLDFYPSALERGTRSEQALTLALAEMYVQGVSTRKVSAILEELCGTSVSSTHVSQCAARLDADFENWRSRPLGTFAYVVLDARYEKVRQAGRVLDSAILIALGIGPDGKRQILGLSVALSEAEVHWRSFLQSLQTRGLRGLQLLVSDDHSGLAAARRAVFPSVPWQRCQFHLQQNAQAYVPRLDMRAKVAADIRSVFLAQDRPSAERRLAELLTAYSASAPKLAAWMEHNLPEGFTVFSLPPAHQRRLRTSNALERVNQELKRRTRVASIFPNEPSLLRLCSALLCEISDDWQSGKIYLDMNPSIPSSP